MELDLLLDPASRNCTLWRFQNLPDALRLFHLFQSPDSSETLNLNLDLNPDQCLPA